MADIILTPTVVAQKAEDLRSYATQLTNDKEDFESAEEALAGMWDGEAKDSFRTKFQTGMQHVQTYIEAVNNYAAALDEIKQELEEADRRSAEAVQ